MGALARAEAGTLRQDAALLARLEAAIARGLDRFHAVARALHQIHERGLYRLAGFATFAAYCEQKWGFTRQHGYRLVTYAEVIEDVSPTGLQPLERQARELAPLEPAERLRVWQEATAGPAPPTAGRVRQLAAKALAGLPPAEQAELVAASERRLLGGQTARRVIAAGRAERMARIGRLMARLQKLVAGLGDEAERALQLLAQANAVLQALDPEATA